MALFQPDNVASVSKDGKQLSYKEYMELKRQKEEKANRKLPKPLKVALLIPVYLIFGFGILYIPYIIYKVVSGN